MKPHREGLRPLLPQHARHCPVLEAGSALGFLVYPPLTEKESFHIEFQGEGRYQFIYSLKKPTGDFEPIFSVTIVLPVGTIGMIKEDVSILSRKTAMNRNDALRLMRAFIVPEDLATPPDSARLGHRLHSNFQHDRSARCSNVGRSGRDGLVRPRNRVPLCSSAWRRDLHSTQYAHRAGFLRAT